MAGPDDIVGALGQLRVVAACHGAAVQHHEVPPGGVRVLGGEGSGQDGAPVEVHDEAVLVSVLTAPAQ